MTKGTQEALIVLNMKIGIIYIVTGIYVDFWNDFYQSCEQFFCYDAEKGYEVFTDSEDLLSQKYKNVRFHKIEDQGWVKNVSYKSYYICGIKELLGMYDYIFYLNGNYKALAPIHSSEILPCEADGWITALSFSHYLSIPTDEYAYDRNMNSNAFIPFDLGERYYQSGFYGGRTSEFVLLSEILKKETQIDLDKGVIARFHDESYLNRFLVGKSPKIINERIAYHNFWNSCMSYKGIFLNKEQCLGNNRVQKIKFQEIENALPVGEKSVMYIDNKARNMTSLGLFEGKMGAAIILFLYARISGNLLYNWKGEQLINRIFNNISTATPLSFADGVFGISWGICFLINQKFLDGDVNEVLEEVDSFILDNCNQGENVDMIDDLENIQAYISMRSTFGLPMTFDKMKQDFGLKTFTELTVNGILDKILGSQCLDDDMRASVANILRTDDYRS